MSAKAKTDEPKSVILRFGKENNFVSWRNFQIDACTREFDFQTNDLKDGVVYIPRAVVSEHTLYTTYILYVRWILYPPHNVHIHPFVFQLPRSGSPHVMISPDDEAHYAQF